MKKIMFLTVLFAIAASICVYGQELVKTKCTDGKYGFKDKKTGEMVIPCKYERVAFNTVPGTASVKFNGKWGVIDITTGRVIIPIKYDQIYDFLEGLASVSFDGKWGYADIDGNFYNSIGTAKREREAILAQKEVAESEQMEMSDAGKSDVAVNIPVTNTKNDKTFAVIIANENYQRVSRVEFAKNDGKTFKKYCVQTLGLPETNVHFLADATLNNIRGEINWLYQVADAFKGGANIIFYYAGHGIPDEARGTAYLLPVDGYGSDVQTGYKLDDLYQKLGQAPARNITVFLDACFSGAQRSGEMMASARGVAIKVAPGAPTGNMVVFSAAQGDETAFPYREKGHGMFTYFMLKKLQETKGDVTLGELGEYIETNVRQRSIVVNQKSQTPVVTPSVAMGDKWKEMKLK